MAITRQALTQILANKAALAAITDAQAADLVAAWARAWDEINADMLAAIEDMMADAASGDRARVSRLNRLRKANAALRICAAQLETLAEAAGVRISADALRVIRSAVAGETRLIGVQLPPGLRGSLLRVDARQLDAIVRRSTQQITALTKPLSEQATTAVKRELTRSMAIGDNPNVAARRMLARTEGAFNGGLNRAKTIARTETLDAYREAAKASHTANAKVLDGWEWVASLSARTCPACLSMHGSKHPTDEPGPQGHQNCRCARVPITKSWAELGFPELDEPKPLTVDGRQWFERQDEATQRNILGPSRYDAYRAGRYPIDQWATVRHTPGWRDSVVPSPAPVRRAEVA